MDGHGAGLRSRGARGSEKLVELPRLPCDRGELKLNGCRGLAGKDAADDEYARIGAESAGDDALFNTGYAEPLCAGANDRWRAQCKRVSVGVGFDDGQQFGMRRGEAGEKTEVLFEGANANLNPAGARCHRSGHVGGGKDQFTAWPQSDVTTQCGEAMRRGDGALPLPLEGKFFPRR